MAPPPDPPIPQEESSQSPTLGLEKAKIKSLNQSFPNEYNS